MEKKAKFANIVVTFGRSPIAIYATYLSPVYFTFNAESNPSYPFGIQMKENVAKLAISIEMVKSS